jgi:hypothetical protein
MRVYEIRYIWQEKTLGWRFKINGPALVPESGVSYPTRFTIGVFILYLR